MQTLAAILNVVGAGRGAGGDTTPGGALDALLLEDGASGLLLESADDILMETA